MARRQPREANAIITYSVEREEEEEEEEEEQREEKRNTTAFAAEQLTAEAGDVIYESSRKFKSILNMIMEGAV